MSCNCENKEGLVPKENLSIRRVTNGWQVVPETFNWNDNRKASKVVSVFNELTDLLAFIEKHFG